MEILRKLIEKTIKPDSQMVPLENAAMNIQIKPITRENAGVLKLPNDPFLQTGRIIPVYDGEKWAYRTELFPDKDVVEDCFPDENYKFEEMGNNFYGLAAYLGEECAGYALFYTHFNAYLYLDNILVPKKYRRKGIGKALLDAGMELALSLGKIGVWLICQDNNLQAANFYFDNGYELGGMDLRRYEGTNQAGKGDLFLYKRAGDQ